MEIWEFFFLWASGLAGETWGAGGWEEVFYLRRFLKRFFFRRIFMWVGFFVEGFLWRITKVFEWFLSDFVLS